MKKPDPTKTDQKAGGLQPGNRRFIVAAVVVAALFGLFYMSSARLNNPATKLSYGDFLDRTNQGLVKSVKVSNDTGKIEGVLCAEATNQNDKTCTSANDGEKFTASGPRPASENDVAAIRKTGTTIFFTSAEASLIGSILPFLIIFGFFAAIWWWMSRRAQGQMSGVMNVGRSKAKVYTTERPKTTFNDVAGYNGVKTEIREVVDFLKTPQRFRDIGAKIPKGVLLVGPPGTGKTLLARAVAGEAGVPFLSITGSDFMEMFVGVGASRVRDLFQTARKQSPAIIFIDEIDSIGRKRGAGVGGGHDEREQTLNQMLAEMDGFEVTESVVVMAATNRPDILDAALLRPGRFDRQIVVPLPDLEERLPILQVHCKDKKMSSDVDLSIVARGTPGMSGADLANLINEAALHAVRRNVTEVHMSDIDAARDRVLMGARRDSLVLSPAEKESTAYHEGGHALLAYVLPNADPVHKVTIIPTGMALGVTQMLPSEERHSYDLEYMKERLTVSMGGRCAEKLIYNKLNTGASNDLQNATEMARSMVREYGMSERVGPMAWGSQGMVFLGDDLMRSRDYSENMSRVIDQEVERILREAEAAATEMLTKHRGGLELVARALLETETIDGAKVTELVDRANGGPVHPNGKKAAPTFSTPVDIAPVSGGSDVITPAVSPTQPPFLAPPTS